uniref:RHS repeat-associated core domain-containing protein n=1 Tax=Streptacidiphilus melanogenes TaxID=411235 RepID=UPI0005AB2CC3
ASTGLVDVGARKYDATTGRFISVDPLFEADDPQSLGGYAYAGDDPVSASDPTGLDDGCDPWFPISCAWNSLFDTTNNAAQKYLEKPTMAVAEDLNPLPDIWHCTDSIDLRCGLGVVSVVPLGKGVGLAAKLGSKADDFFRAGRDADDLLNGGNKLDKAIGKDYSGDPRVDPNGTGADPGGPTDHGDEQAKAYKANQDNVNSLPGKLNDIRKAFGPFGQTDQWDEWMTGHAQPRAAADPVNHALGLANAWLGAAVTTVVLGRWVKSIGEWLRANPFRRYVAKHAIDDGAKAITKQAVDDSVDTAHVRGHHLYE